MGSLAKAKGEKKAGPAQESKMKAERLEFQTAIIKQSQALSACQPRKAIPRTLLIHTSKPSTALKACPWNAQ
eukprot:380338-Pelagomonas_calceolata.AAC.1